MATPTPEPIDASDRTSRDAEILARAALHVPTAGLADFLDDCCGADRRLRIAVDRMLDAIRAAESDPEDVSVRFRAEDARATVASDDIRFRGGSFGPYRLLRRIGEGGSGVVFESVGPKGSVAIKILRQGSGDNARGERRIRREINLLRRLSHPGIASYCDHGRTQPGEGSELYVAVELVAGSPLTEYAHRCGLDDARRVELIEQACAALGYAHAKGVVHRDLKPANLLVDTSGRLKVIDFGVAAAEPERFDSSQTSAGRSFVGTVAYAAPEQVSGRRVDGRADIYSLGVVLFELLTGTTPYHLKDGGLFDLVDAVRSHRTKRLADLRPDISPDLEAITEHALDPDRERRYRDCAELAADLQRFRERKPVSVRSPGLNDLLRREVRRRPVVTAAVIAVVLAVAGAGVLVYSTARREADLAASTLESVACQLTQIAEARDQGFPPTAQLQLLSAAEAALNSIARVRPADGLFLRTHAKVARLQGEASLSLDDFVDASTRFRVASADHESLKAHFDSTQDDRLDAIVIMVKLGEVAKAQHDASTCEALFAEALKLNEAEARNDPTPRALDDLASSYDRCAFMAAQEHGDWRNAERLYRRMKEVADTLGTIAPERLTGLRAKFDARRHLLGLAEATKDDELSQSLVAELGPLVAELMRREPDGLDHLESAMSVERSRARLRAIAWRKDGGGSTRAVGGRSGSRAPPRRDLRTRATLGFA